MDTEAGLTQELGDGTRTYLYGVGRIAQDGGAIRMAAGKEYFLADALGSVRLLVDESGQPVMDRAYKPYGETLDSSGSGSSAYGFTGEAEDAATGLTYLRARYYSAAQGRFISRDVWGGDYERPLSLNRWVYGFANPARFVDPSGHRPWCPPGEQQDCEIVVEYKDLNYGITFSTLPAEGAKLQWLPEDRVAVMDGVRAVASKMSGTIRGMGFAMSPDLVFRKAFGPVEFVLASQEIKEEKEKDEENVDIVKKKKPREKGGDFCERLEGRGVICYPDTYGKLVGHWMAHELGHVFNATISNKRDQGEIPTDTVTPYDALY